ncbi:unnamed protein product [Taenia asiatica]|uniref:Secreted protein n=1 Tax=Taenia asiatica TaxID=60517 RepID=A0A0R3WCY4_TAEAS|nr:unnamed protein product [Taenia asiatica]
MFSDAISDHMRTCLHARTHACTHACTPPGACCPMAPDDPCARTIIDRQIVWASVAVLPSSDTRTCDTAYDYTRPPGHATGYDEG